MGILLPSLAWGQIQEVRVIPNLQPAKERRKEPTGTGSPRNKIVPLLGCAVLCFCCRGSGKIAKFTDNSLLHVMESAFIAPRRPAEKQAGWEERCAQGNPATLDQSPKSFGIC